MNRLFKWLFRNTARSLVADACLGTYGLEIAFCPLCRKYEAYGSGTGEKYVLEHGGTKQGNHIRVPAKLAKEIILQCTCAEFEGCHKPLCKTRKSCACADSDAKTCYFLRYPNQQELNGRDYCECSCHNVQNEGEGK